MNPFENLDRCRQCSHSNSVAKFAVVCLAVAFIAFVSSFHDDSDTAPQIKPKHKRVRVVTVEAVKDAVPTPMSSSVEIEKAGDK
jgi:hypothetical protein